MGQIVILMGPTGAGKSVQGEKLAARGWKHISSGELLRADGEWAPTLASGELAPSSAVEGLVDAAVLAVPVDQPIVLDGFPRTADEASWMQAKLGDWQRELSHVIVLNVTESALMSRLGTRARNDDTPAAIAEKLAEYHEVTSSVLGHYQQLGKLVEINGDESIQNVFNNIMKVLS